jgi:hypothetical protein
MSRNIGLQHQLIVNDTNEVFGIVTRKDLELGGIKAEWGKNNSISREI